MRGGEPLDAWLDRSVLALRVAADGEDLDLDRPPGGVDGGTHLGR